MQNREKQIEEMAKISCNTNNSEIKWECAECPFNTVCDIQISCEALYNAGYRKQSEGCDFCKAGNEKCGTCVKFFDYYEDGDGNERCSTEYGNEKCAYYKPVHFCSNCGAKMKGGGE